MGKKIRTRTLFWAVQLRDEDIDVLIGDITRSIGYITRLTGTFVPNDRVRRPEFHCTLLYTGRKADVRAVAFDGLDGAPCTVTVDGIGYDSKYLTLSVSQMVLAGCGDDAEEEPPAAVPFFGTRPHVTLECAPGCKPSDSFSVLEHMQKYKEPHRLSGIVKEYCID